MTTYKLEVSFFIQRGGDFPPVWTPKTVIAESMSQDAYDKFIKLHGSKFGDIAQAKLIVTETTVKKGDYQNESDIAERKRKHDELNASVQRAFGGKK